MIKSENEAALRWLEDSRELARDENRWKLLKLLDILHEKILFEIRLANQWAREEANVRR